MCRFFTRLLPLVALRACLAEAVTFSVGGFPPSGQSLAVIVGNTPTKLAVGQDGVLWTGAADLPGAGKYKYGIVDASGTVIVSEPFERTLQQGLDRTLNQFWMRPMTTKDHPRLAQVWPVWPQGYSRLFDETYIPTIHITGDNETIMQIMSSKQGNAKVDVVLVGKSETITMKNLTFKAGGQSSKDYDKTQIGLKFPDGADFEGRRSFKLRAGRTDPSFLRERIYTDILNSIGIPVAQGCHARVYINRAFRGLYYFEDGIDDAWGKVVIQPRSDVPVSLATVSAGGNGNFVFGTYDAYSFLLNATDPPVNEMMPAMKALEDFPAATATSEQVNALKQSIDYDMVYKVGSVEYLTSHWDGAWESASNYFLASVNKKWFAISSDFDYTFGTNIGLINGSTNSTLDGWAYGSERIGGGPRPLFEKPLANTQMRGEFINTLKLIVQGVFHEQGIRSRVQSLHDFLRADYADDTNPEINPIITSGKNDNFTLEVFDASWDQGGIAAGHNCPDDVCKYGIISYVKEKSEAVAGLYGFTFDDTYVPPKDGERFGGKAGGEAGPQMPGGNTASSPFGSPQNMSAGHRSTCISHLLPAASALIVHIALS